MRIGVPAGWHSPESTFMPSPEDPNLGQRWWTANHNIPIQRCGAVEFLRVHAEEDVKNDERSVNYCDYNVRILL
jgi:hypothetical protein